MVYTVRFFPVQNAICFIILTYLVPILFIFYVQSVLKLKKNNSGSKRLKVVVFLRLTNVIPERITFVSRGITVLKKSHTSAKIPKRQILQ